MSAAGEPDPRQDAKNICLRMLTERPRTRSELRQGLIRKGVEPELADRVLDRFGDVGLIDDAAFAEVYVRSRHAYQGLGRRALRVELRRKGVDEVLVAAAVEALDEEAEERRARELIDKRLRSSGKIDETKLIRRLVGVLARKGYPQGLSYRVVREALRERGLDTGVLDTEALPTEGLHAERLDDGPVK
jgi:regulatory protein